MAKLEDYAQEVSAKDLETFKKGLAKEEVEVFYTRDYELFFIPEEQRSVNKGAVKQIKASIEEIGYLRENAIQATPYVIEGEVRMVVMDGQHRLKALMALGEEIPFFITKLEISDIPNLQIGPGNWKLSDYYASYAAQGEESYVKILELVEKYSVSLNEIGGVEVAAQNGLRVNGNGYREAVKNKSLEIKDEERLVQWCELLQSMKDIRSRHGVNGIGGHGMKLALHRIFSNPEFSQADIEVLVEKWATNGTPEMSYGSTEEKRALEDLIEAFNFRKNASNRWRVTKTASGNLKLIAP